MSASMAPNVACCRKREASSGVTIGTGGVPFTIAIKSAEVAGPGWDSEPEDQDCPVQSSLRLRANDWQLFHVEHFWLGANKEQLFHVEQFAK